MLRRIEDSSSPTTHLISSPLGHRDTASAIPLCLAEQKETRKERRTFKRRRQRKSGPEGEVHTKKNINSLLEARVGYIYNWMDFFFF